MISTTIAEKYILVPDCDDDRQRPDDYSQFVNRHHAAAQRRVYAKGPMEWSQELGRVRSFLSTDRRGNWSPPMSLLIGKGGIRRETYGALPGTRAGVWARWSQWPVDPENNNHIVIWGGDDTYLERVKLPTEKARRLWGRLNDFITIKTLWRLGFTVT